MKILEPKEIITTLSNKKTGEKYKDEEALKAANIPEEDVQRDVRVIMPPHRSRLSCRKYKCTSN